MEPIKIMVNGMPGNMAVRVADHAGRDNRFFVIPYSLTGPEIEADEHRVGSESFRLIHPDQKKAVFRELIRDEAPFISVDYTHPSAVNPNADFYCGHGLPFVMGTTGGDRTRLLDTVAASATSAVISPNMAKQIVGFQAMMAYAAEQFRGLFKTYSIEIKESHQNGKADTSGTAKAMIEYFNNLGAPIEATDIVMIRDPDIQRDELGIPKAYLNGHAWHTYTLTSEDETVRFQFTHNVNGRDIYAKGTLDAVEYLSQKIREGIHGKVYTMIDVLKGI